MCLCETALDKLVFMQGNLLLLEYIMTKSRSKFIFYDFVVLTWNYCRS